MIEQQQETYMLEQHGMLESGNPSCSREMEPPVKEAMAIDRDPVPPLEASLKEKLEKTLTWESFEPFILSRVPHTVRQSHKDLYKPLVVSIGPYHRGKKSLRAMEAHKPRCLIDFLNRNPKVGLEVYVEKIRELEERARRCYSEAIILNKDEFVEMLLLDGCFLLEFFFKVRAWKPHALLDVGCGVNTIMGDLLLFENQIPFFVVEMLYSIVTCYDGDQESLLRLLEPSSIAPDLQAKGEIYHLLHLYYQWFVPSRILLSRRSNGSTSSSSTLLESPRSRWSINSRLGSSNKKLYTSMQSIPCATQLDEAGVTFKRKESPSDQLDITFENGVMEIPNLLIDSTRKVFYANLMAFEQNCSTMDYNLSSYMALMFSLINTNKDMVLLQRCGIIRKNIAQDELVVFFNQLNNSSMFYSDKHHFSSLFFDVNCYCNLRWPKYRAKLMHDYFNNPWSVLSVIAAIVLLVFSALQVIYSMYPYIHHY